MSRILIVDGSNLLFQMFFGMPSRIVNKDGRAIQGTLGFVGALQRMIRHLKPTHVAVLFDGEHDNDRRLIDPEYKSNRPDYSESDENDNPFSQLPDIYSSLDLLEIKHAETSVCESDDWIAGYALTYGEQCKVIISSFDSDFFQLITDSVSVFRYRGNKSQLCTPSYIRERLGILPSQYADFKSLVGDSADNIKGVPKIGPKTAAELLGTYGSLDGIIENVQSISKPSVKTSLLQNIERLSVNYSLIKLNNSTHLPLTVDCLEYVDKGLSTNEILRSIGLI